jgi:hypothetical protein
VQRELGQGDFTRLVRHAYDSGIRFFETADAYSGMQVMLSTALKGIPRDSYKLMTKFRLPRAREPEAGNRPPAHGVELRLLRHPADALPADSRLGGDVQKLADEFSEAKQKKTDLAHGASCHGLLPLRTFPKNNWLDVALLRVNHDGTRMDTLAGNDSLPDKGDVKEVTSHIKTIRGKGTGVIGMKIMGEGAFKSPEQRDASIRYVMKLGTVDAVTIGFKSPAEIDEAIKRINTHLNS